jgi:hypothetical protein
VRDPEVLRGTGACKPEREDEHHELASLKSAAPGCLEAKTWHKERGPAWEDLEEPQGPHFEATEPQARAASSAEEEDTCIDKN